MPLDPDDDEQLVEAILEEAIRGGGRNRLCKLAGSLSKCPVDQIAELNVLLPPPKYKIPTEPSPEMKSVLPTRPILFYIWLAANLAGVVLVVWLTVHAAAWLTGKLF